MACLKSVCTKNDTLLFKRSWQDLTNTISRFHLLQDNNNGNIWDNLDGQEMDAFIYSSNGLLFSYVGANKTRGNPAIEGNILTNVGYSHILALTTLAAAGCDMQSCTNGIGNGKEIITALPMDFSYNIATDYITSVYAMLLMFIGLAIGLAGSTVLHGISGQTRSANRIGGRNQLRFVELPTVDFEEPDMDDEHHGASRRL